MPQFDLQQAPQHAAEGRLLIDQSLHRAHVEQPALPKLLEASGHERSFGRATWGAINLELWHRQFIDSDGLTPLN